jgi:NarL family two-component system response regulator LiaR
VIRILVADDHAVVRQGLRSFLGLQDDMEVVGEASDGAEAVDSVERLRPDVVLMDLAMPGVDGVEAIRRIHASRPETRVVVLTSFTDDTKVLPAVRAGAVGYLLKDVEPAELASAIRTVAAGQALLAPAVTARVLREIGGAGSDRAPGPSLTPRELEVLGLLARGLSNRQIAADLVLSEKTVKTHVSSILGKLRLADRTQAALYAVREGLVEGKT